MKSEDPPFCHIGHRECTLQFVVCMCCHRYAETLPPTLRRDPTLNQSYARAIHRTECLKCYSPNYRVGTILPPPVSDRHDVIIDVRSNLFTDAFVVRVNNSLLFYNTD